MDGNVLRRFGPAVRSVPVGSSRFSPSGLRNFYRSVWCVYWDLAAGKEIYRVNLDQKTQTGTGLFADGFGSRWTQSPLRCLGRHCDACGLATIATTVSNWENADGKASSEDAVCHGQCRVGVFTVLAAFFFLAGALYLRQIRCQEPISGIDARKSFFKCLPPFSSHLESQPY